MTGISYNGVDTSSGGVDWYGLANVHLIKHEMGLTLQVYYRLNIAQVVSISIYGKVCTVFIVCVVFPVQTVIDTFNLNTNQWVAW